MSTSENVGRGGTEPKEGGRPDKAMGGDMWNGKGRTSMNVVPSNPHPARMGGVAKKPMGGHAYKGTK